MSAPVAEDLFEPLLVGIRAFRARVEQGESRERLLRLQGQPGTISDITRWVLEALRDALAWLHRALEQLDGPLDALMAVFELLGQGLTALGEVLGRALAPAEIAPISAGLAALGSTLDGVGDIALPVRIPDPTTIAAIRVETRALLGQRVDPEADPPIGSLDELLTRLTAA